MIRTMLSDLESTNMIPGPSEGDTAGFCLLPAWVAQARRLQANGADRKRGSDRNE